MRIHFYGTKGFVEESSRAHRGHSAFVLEADGFRLLCDMGENRGGMLAEIRPDAVFVSHAHPDHARGLAEGTDRPVYASAVTHAITADLPLSDRRTLTPARPVPVGPFRLTGFPVVHSVRCPCTAARVETERLVLVYSGDIVAFPDRVRALAGASVYVGDGSTLKGSLVRRHASGELIGHTTVRAQLGWLAQAAVPRAVFSHFGRGPILMGERALRKALDALAAQKAPRCDVTAARDGMSIEV